MNDKDKIWLEKCIAEPDKYKIDVDNDCVCVYDQTNDEGVHTFSEYGYSFALQLLKYIGCNADMV